MKRLLLLSASIAVCGLAVANAQISERSGNAQMPEQQYGWQQDPEPIDPEELDRPLTELERLSLSESGFRYARDTYDPRADNPLEPVSVTLRALDKITARYSDLVIDMDAEAKFGTLSITPRTCDKRPPEEVPEVTAFLEIRATDDFVRLPSSDGSEPTGAADADDGVGGIDTAEKVENDLAQPEDGDNEVLTTPATFTDDVDATTGGLTGDDDDGDGTLFEGWMFASSPALNALEHPVYDVWVIDCRMVDPSI